MRPFGALADAPCRARFYFIRLRGARQGRSLVNAPAPRTLLDRPTRPPWRDVRQPTSCRLFCSFGRQFYAVPVRFVAPRRGVCGGALSGAIIFYFAYAARGRGVRDLTLSVTACAVPALPLPLGDGERLMKALCVVLLVGDFMQSP